MADKNIRSHAIGCRLFARLALQVGACLVREVCGGLADIEAFGTAQHRRTAGNVRHLMNPKKDTLSDTGAAD